MDNSSMVTNFFLKDRLSDKKWERIFYRKVEYL